MPRGVRVTDLFVAGGALALTTLLMLGWATRVELHAARGATRVVELVAREAAAAQTLAELERRAGEDAAMRRSVARRVEDLQTRYPARFSWALSEAGRMRPAGVWLTRFHWTGTEVKAEGRAWGAAPAAEFAGRLARSPRFAQVFTSQAGEKAAAGAGPTRFLLFARAVGD
jgi:hypothetical protein